MSYDDLMLYVSTKEKGEQKRPQSVNKHLNGTAANSADFVWHAE
jgi:hypothetical protein